MLMLQSNTEKFLYAYMIQQYIQQWPKLRAQNREAHAVNGKIMAPK